MKTKSLKNHQPTKHLMLSFGLACLLFANKSSAVSEYLTAIPNGAVISCIACHVNADPDADGTERNVFGLAWRNNTPTRTYNALLANKDSDADGFTNGQELGDSAGTWVPGNPNPAGPVFNPGDAASHPTATTTPPTITSVAPPATGTVGTAYNFTVTATGTAPITFSAVNLPAGLAINPTTGVISGTPTTTGTFNGTITAANGTQPNGTQNFSIVIGAAPVLGIFRTTTNTVAVFWPSPSTGWVLEVNTNSVSSANWSNVTATIQDNGTTKTLIVNPPADYRFYRLKY